MRLLIGGRGSNCLESAEGVWERGNDCIELGGLRGGELQRAERKKEPTAFTHSLRV
jgi:hypothetical protein